MTDEGIRERSPGHYEIRAYHPDTKKQVTMTFVGGIRGARQARARLVSDIAAGKHGGGRGTLGGLVTAYVDSRERAGSSPSTIAGYRSIERTVAAGPGATRLDKLGAHDLDTWYNDLRADGYSPARIHHFHRLVSAALAQGERWGWISSNPARLTTRITVPRPTMTVPPPADVVRLIDAAAASRAPDMAAIITVAALTGLRRGEMAGLRWSDVIADSLTVRRSIWQTGKRWGEKLPKSHQVRPVSVGPRVGATLDLVWRAQKARAEAAGCGLVDDPYVFSPDPDGDTPKMPDVISQRFRKLCDAAGLPRYRFHDLRHYSATELLAAGHSVVDVSGRLGHADPAITLRVYAHPSAEAARAMGGALDSGLA